MSSILDVQSDDCVTHSKELHNYSDKSKCQSAFRLWVTLSPPAVSCTLFTSSSPPIYPHLSSSSFLLRLLHLFYSCPFFPHRGDPCPGFVSLLVLRMKLLVFVRLSEVATEWKRERDNLVDWDGCICRGGRVFSGQFTLTLLCLHYTAINMKPRPLHTLKIYTVHYSWTLELGINFLTASFGTKAKHYTSLNPSFEFLSFRKWCQISQHKLLYINYVCVKVTKLSFKSGNIWSRGMIR